MLKKTRDYQSWRLEKLADQEIAEGYLNSALEDSPQMFLKALLNVVQARQVAAIAAKAQVERETIYRAFSKGGNPTLNTLSSVLRALGLEIRVIREGTPYQKAASSIQQYAQQSSTRRKAHSRRKINLEAAGQTKLPFTDVVNVRGVAASGISLLTEMPKPNYIYIGTVNQQVGFASPPLHSPFLNPTRQGGTEMVPGDLLVAPSTGSNPSIRI